MHRSLPLVLFGALDCTWVALLGRLSILFDMSPVWVVEELCYVWLCCVDYSAVSFAKSGFPVCVNVLCAFCCCLQVLCLSRIRAEWLLHCFYPVLMQYRCLHPCSVISQSTEVIKSIQCISTWIQATVKVDVTISANKHYPSLANLNSIVMLL